MFSGKRERESKKARKKRDKEERRRERREAGPADFEVVSAEELTGAPLHSVEEVMAMVQGERLEGAESANRTPVKLFVGSLSFETTTEELRSVFERHGEVADAVVIRDRSTGQSRGFGFVTMADRKDAVKAIDALDGADVDGRYIKVNVATERR